MSKNQFLDYADYAWIQHFLNGGQYDGRTSNEYRARAVRRVYITEEAE